MMGGKQFLTFHSPAGAVKISNPIDFFRGVPREIVQHQTVEIPIHPVAERAYDSVFDSMGSFQRRVLQLKECLRHEIPHREAMSKRMDLNHMAHYVRETELLDKLVKMADKSFKPLVAKKKPAFLVKDMTIEKIQDLSIEYLKNFGSSSIVAFEYALSPYQKFFVMGDQSAFRYYTTDVHTNEDMMRRSYLFFADAEFAELRPDQWVIGRYEEATYLKEMFAMQRYQVGGE